MSAPSPRSLVELLRSALGVRALRFAVVGTSNVVIGFLSFWSVYHLLPELRTRAGIAQLVTYAIGTVWSYFWNRRWTFASNQGVAREATRFVATQCVFGALSSLLMHLAVDVASLPKAPTWLVVSTFVTVLNFLTARYWVFRAAGAQRPGDDLSRRARS